MVTRRELHEIMATGQPTLAQQRRATVPFTGPLTTHALLECLADYGRMESGCFDKRWLAWLHAMAASTNGVPAYYDVTSTLAALAGTLC